MLVISVQNACGKKRELNCVHGKNIMYTRKEFQHYAEQFRKLQNTAGSKE